MKIYFSIEDAKACGLTHEGRLFGVPAWMRCSNDEFMAVPKFVPFNAWTLFCDWAFDVAADLLCNRSTGPMVAPIHVGRSIAEIESQSKS